MSVRHDWYQSEEYVKVTVLLKNAVEKNYKVKIESEKVELTADEGYDLTLNLLKPINVEKSSHKATPAKVEITLYKLIGDRWDNLEKKVVVETPQPAKTKPNWDKLATEFEAQEAEERKGEEALQALFKKIYSDSTPEVKKAMNKSYSESSGTVLSTNWNEVSSKTVEVKPVDGTECKTFES